MRSTRPQATRERVPLEWEKDHSFVHVGHGVIWFPVDRTLKILKCALVVATAGNPKWK